MLTCYVLVRHLPRTMNPGKAMTQVHHAGTHMMKTCPDHPDVKEWLTQGNGFGTVITLTAKDKADNLFQIEELVSLARLKNLVNGIIIDPTYPIDHELTASVETCGYILVDNNCPSVINIIKEEWELHP